MASVIASNFSTANHANSRKKTVIRMMNPVMVRAPVMRIQANVHALTLIMEKTVNFLRKTWWRSLTPFPKRWQNSKQ